MKFKLLFILCLFTELVMGQIFHDTQGKLEISSGGQAVFTLPIAMSQSIQDVGPKIDLLYSSGQLSGVAGAGWNISGLSYISRTATRMDIDGYIDGVDFDDNDKLSFNGQRLLLKTTSGSGVYWADNSEYETEMQSNTKFELKGTGDNIYFIVTAADGSRSWFGNYGGVLGYDNTLIILCVMKIPMVTLLLIIIQSLWQKVCVFQKLISVPILTVIQQL